MCATLLDMSLQRIGVEHMTLAFTEQPYQLNLYIHYSYFLLSYLLLFTSLQGVRTLWDHSGAFP